MKRSFFFLFLGLLHVIASGQNVGIGTTNPTAPLDVKGKIKADSLELNKSATDSIFLEARVKSIETMVQQVDSAMIFDAFDFISQEFVSLWNGKIKSIEFYFSQPQFADDAIYIQELNKYLIKNYPGENWVSYSPTEDIFIQSDSLYTIWNANNGSYTMRGGDGNPYPQGNSSLCPTCDFTFRVNVEKDGKPLVIHSSFFPSNELFVNGKVKTTNFQMSNGAQNGRILSSDSNGNASWVSKDLAGYWTQNANNLFTNVSGNVGIGTSNPQAKLHLLKSSSAAGTNNFLLLENTLSGGAGIRFKNSLVPANPWQAYVENNGKFTIGREGVSEDITVLQNGDVGIGNENPIATLDVDGSIRTKYSGSIVITPLVSTGMQGIVLNIPSVPTGWDNTNTMVLVSVSDGTAVLTIHQVNLNSMTTIYVLCTVNTIGTARLNYIIFKL